MINCKILPSAINSDDEARMLQQTECLNIENLRVGVSEDGNNYSLKNIPSTILLFDSLPNGGNKTIGRAADLSRQRFLWLNYNDAGQHGIYAYDMPLGIIYIVLLSSQTAEGLNFSPYYRTDRNIRVVGDLLLWTDNYNEPRCINIEAGIKLNQSGYVTSVLPYVTPIDYGTITLIKKPPAYELTVAKVMDSGFDNNYTANRAYQFNYRYRYRDYQRSALSAFSYLIPYNFKADTFNAVDVKLPFVEKINDEVRYVDICVRYGNEGKTYAVKTFDKSNAADAAAIVLHNAGTTQLGFRFYDNIRGLAVDDIDAEIPFDGVPRLAETLEVAKNREFFGNILSGYNSPATTSLAATISSAISQSRIFKSGSSVKISIEFLDRFRRKCGAVRTDIILNFPERTYSQTSFPYLINWTLSNTSALAEIPIWAYYYQILITVNQAKYFYVQTISRQISYVKRNNDGTFDYAGTTYDDVDTYALAIDISNLSVYSEGYVYDAANSDFAVLYRADGTNNDLKVLGQDGNYVLLSPVDFGDITNLYKFTIPADDLEQFTNLINVTFSSSVNPSASVTTHSQTAASISDLDDLKVSSNFVLNFTDGNEYDISMQGVIKIFAASGSGTLFNFSIHAIATSPTEDSVDVVLHSRSGTGAAFTATINSSIHIPAGYDKLFIYTIYSADTGFIQSGSYINFSTNGVTLSLIELYTPYKPSQNELFYEVPGVHAIANPATNSRVYSTLSGTIPGDSYLINRTIYTNTEFLVESMSPNDNVWQSWERDLGWVNQVTDIGEQRTSEDIVWSDTYINGTKANGLNKFQPLNRKTIGSTSGAIQKLQLTSKQQEDGNVIVIITENTSLSAYLSERQLVAAAKNSDVATTDEVIGTINEHQSGRGTINPESVVEYDGSIWWADAIHGLIAQYSQNGVYAVSDFKLNRFFDRYFKKYLSLGFNRYTNPVHSGYDVSVDEVMFELPQVDATTISSNAIGSYTAAGSCVPVTVGAVVIPDGTVGVFYSFSFPLMGTPPFTVSSPVAPAGLNYLVSGSSIILSGTPTTAGVGQTASFSANNCSGSFTAISQTIDIFTGSGGGGGGNGFAVTEPSNNTGGKIHSTLTVGGVSKGFFTLTPQNSTFSGTYASSLTNTSVVLVVNDSTVAINTIFMIISGVMGNIYPVISGTGANHSATYTWNHLNLAPDPTFAIYINLVN